MSNHDSDSENDKLLDFIAEEGFELIGNDFYRCPGDHIWHWDDIVKLYVESKPKGE
jgi:hypothetical protein